METEEQARKRLGRNYIHIWDGCTPVVSQAIKDFRESWAPYSVSSRRYSIVRLIEELIDPAIATYLATLPKHYLGYVPGAGIGISFSGIIRSVGFYVMMRSQRLLLRQFVTTVDKQTPRDRCYVATLEALIILVCDCSYKRPKSSAAAQGVKLNAQRRRGFCDLCGNLTEFSAFIDKVGELQSYQEIEDHEKLVLSHQYCQKHRPKLMNGKWNHAYRQAKRSIEQFEIELNRLTRQSTSLSMPKAASGDPLVDDYIYHYLLKNARGILPADKAELRNLARLMVDKRLSDTKKKMLVLLYYGFNQSQIANKLPSDKEQPMTRQAVSKALASIPDIFDLRKPNKHIVY